MPWISFSRTIDLLIVQLRYSHDTRCWYVRFGRNGRLRPLWRRR